MPNGVTLLTDKDIESLPYMLDTKQAAAVCGVSTRTIYNHVERGNLPAHTVGGVYRFAKPEVLAFAGLWHLIDKRYWERLEGIARELRRYRSGVDESLKLPYER